MLKGKTVLLGVSGSIAAYKTAYLASALKKLRADVHVLMTQNAVNFINPITFETLTGNKCLVDTFDRNFEFSVEHVSLAKQADVVMIAPASADVIGKIAHGIADDMLTTTVMACRCRKIIAPAMNTNMFENPIVQDNLETLRKNGRLSSVKALVASTLSIKPVMAGDKGVIVQRGQSIGIKKALGKMADMVVSEAPDAKNRILMISHCNALKRAEFVRDMIMEKAAFQRTVIMDTRGVSSMYANDGGVIVTV